MKITFDELRKIKTNSVMEYKGTGPELNAAKSVVWNMNILHSDEGRKYSLRTDHKKGAVYITVTELGKKLSKA